MNRILVVDDEWCIRLFYQDVFEGIGYKVVTSNGHQPIQSLLDQEQPDLLILHISPDDAKSELNMLQEVKSKNMDIPIILYTSDENFRNELKSVAADFVLISPGIEPLLDRVQELLPNVVPMNLLQN